MARAAGSDSVVKLRGGRVFWNGVVLFGGDSVQAVAVFKGDGVALGLGLRAPIRSSSCLAAGFIRDGVVMFGGGTVQAVAVFKGDCVCTWARAAGSNSVVKLLGGRGTIGMVSSQLVAALCKQLPCLKVTAWFLGSGLRGLN